ncbi:Bax inhibitor-1/YccA family membrane protein [Streptomyces sp. NPDC054786]
MIPRCLPGPGCRRCGGPRRRGRWGRCWDGGVLAIAVSVVAIAAASYFFLVEFETANRFLQSGASHRWAWYVAFGLAMTLVRLYLEILRLLSYLRWW